MPLQDHSLFVELEATLTHGPGSQRFTILRRMTDLFLAGSNSYTDEHVAIFDELMGRLIEKIERQALIELSGRLAPVERAPVNVIGCLSRDEDIGISGPILEQSTALTATAHRAWAVGGVACRPRSRRRRAACRIVRCPRA